MHISPHIPHRAAGSVSYSLIDIEERFLTPPPVTFFSTLRRLPASEIVAGTAFAALVALLFLGLAVFS